MDFRIWTAQFGERGFWIPEAVREGGDEPFLDFGAPGRGHGERDAEERVVERVGAALLDVRLHHHHHAAVVAALRVRAAARVFLRVERAVDRALPAPDRALAVFGEERLLHLVAVLQVARAERVEPLPLLGLERVHDVRVRLLEERRLLPPGAAVAHQRGELHVDRELLRADHVADLARVGGVHAVAPEFFVHRAGRDLRIVRPLRGEARDDAEVHGGHVRRAAVVVRRRRAFADVALHQARDRRLLGVRRPVEDHAARDFGDDHRLDAAEVGERLLRERARGPGGVRMVDDACQFLLEVFRLLRAEPLVDGGELPVVHRVDRGEEVLLDELGSLERGIGNLPAHLRRGGDVRGRVRLGDRRVARNRVKLARVDFAVDVGAEGVQVAQHRREVDLAVLAELERGERVGGGRRLPRLRLFDLGILAEADAGHLVRAELRHVHRLAAGVDRRRAAHLLVGERDERLDLARGEGRAAVGLQVALERVAQPGAVVVGVGLEEGVRRGLVGVRAVVRLVLRGLERPVLDVDELVRALGGDGAESVDVEGHGGGLSIGLSGLDEAFRREGSRGLGPRHFRGGCRRRAE